MQKFVLFFFLAISSTGAGAQHLLLKKGMKIDRSVTIRAFDYNYRADTDLNNPFLTISGNNIVVDFNGAILTGASSGMLPNEFSGLAIKIEKGKNITIKNLHVHGFRIALYAEEVEQLKIENADFSFNYRPGNNLDKNRKPNQANDLAAVVLNNCLHTAISNSAITNNHIGLLVKNSSGSFVHNSNVSYNSAHGILLANADDGKYLYNKIIFNYGDSSDQSSSAIKLSGTSSGNLFYKNAITHHINGAIIQLENMLVMKNVFMENDFSFAVQKGIVNYSDNTLVNKNRIYNTTLAVESTDAENVVISNNHFRFNETGIHLRNSGSGIIHHNLFYMDDVAFKLDKNIFNTDQTDKLVAVLVANSFNQNRVVYDIHHADSVAEFNNVYNSYEILFRSDTSMFNIDPMENDELLVRLSEDYEPVLPEIENPENPFRGGNVYAGRQFILPGNWGPYNFSYPMAIAGEIDSTGHFEILLAGPPGKVRILNDAGYELLLPTDSALRKILAKGQSGKNPASILLEFKGERFRDESGRWHAAGKPFLFRPQLPLFKD